MVLVENLVVVVQKVTRKSEDTKIVVAQKRDPFAFIQKLKEILNLKCSEKTTSCTLL